MTEISLMRVEDVEAVHAIEEACFAIPWSRESFLREVTENQCARYLVMREDGECVAYACLLYTSGTVLLVTTSLYFFMFCPMVRATAST